MKKKFVLFGAVTIVVLLALYAWMPGSAPSGQPALVRLTSGTVAQFKAAFDADANVPHVVLLLSPT